MARSQFLLPSHAELRPLSRVAVADPAEQAAWEAAVLLLSGVGAACCVQFMDLDLRLPGHAILRTVIPLTLGFALAPRRMAGVAMSLSAAATTGGLWAAGFDHGGFGAMTSLLLCGPIFDVALWRAKSGWSVYLRCAAAGLAVNMIALAVRASDKLILQGALRGMGRGAGTGGGGGRGLGSGVGVGRGGSVAREFSDWWPTALPTYAAFGLLAGLVMALLLFRWAPRQRPGVAP
jgi:hypothetical protein